MKKGLRHENPEFALLRKVVSLLPPPDEEGIETYEFKLARWHYVNNNVLLPTPDEEGIET